MSNMSLSQFVTTASKYLEKTTAGRKWAAFNEIVNWLVDGRFSPERSTSDYIVEWVDEGLTGPAEFNRITNGCLTGHFVKIASDGKRTKEYIYRYEPFDCRFDIKMNDDGSIRLRSWKDSYGTYKDWNKGFDRYEYKLTLPSDTMLPMAEQVYNHLKGKGLYLYDVNHKWVRIESARDGFNRYFDALKGNGQYVYKFVQDGVKCRDKQSGNVFHGSISQCQCSHSQLYPHNEPAFDTNGFPSVLVDMDRLNLFWKGYELPIHNVAYHSRYPLDGHWLIEVETPWGDEVWTIEER